MKGFMILEKIYHGVVHQIAYCRHCDWRNEDYRHGKARKEGYKHAKSTGHGVAVETAIAYSYKEGKTNEPK